MTDLSHLQHLAPIRKVLDDVRPDQSPQTEAAENWLFTYFLVSEHDDPHFTVILALAFISIAAFYTHSTPVLRAYPSASVGMGALMLARHLCATGRPAPAPLETQCETEEALEVMTVLDRIVRNDHSLIADDVCTVSPWVNWKLLDAIDQFYEVWGDEVEPVPDTLELYLGTPTAEDYESGRRERPKAKLERPP